MQPREGEGIISPEEREKMVEEGVKKMEDAYKKFTEESIRLLTDYRKKKAEVGYSDDLYKQLDFDLDKNVSEFEETWSKSVNDMVRNEVYDILLKKENGTLWQQLLDF